MSLLTAAGRRIREIRSSRGWSQAELAARAGLATQQIGKLETGKLSAPVLVQLCKISAELGIPLSELLEEPAWVSLPTSLHDAALVRKASYQVVNSLNKPAVRASFQQPDDWLRALALSQDDPTLFEILLHHPDIIDSLRKSA